MKKLILGLALLSTQANALILTQNLKSTNVSEAVKQLEMSLRPQNYQCGRHSFYELVGMDIKVRETEEYNYGSRVYALEGSAEYYCPPFSW
jgi:hypothetical protein